jgi:NAD(P)H-hydrate repair Nnr-like enzyme with NAD(P)H-hydrate dehydratase domain
LKRCGGQGDILAGLLIVYCYWAKLKELDFSSQNENLLLGAVLACFTLRKAGQKAFEKKFIGLTAPDIIDEIIQSFLELLAAGKRK